MSPSDAPFTPTGGLRLARRAKAFLAGIILAAVAAAFPAVLALHPDGGDLLTFGLLAGAAALGQILVVETGRNHGFPIAIAFVVAGALLLPPGLIALLGLAMHAPDIIRRRFPWYIQTFNTGNLTLNALAAWTSARAVADLEATGSDLRWAAAGLAACLAFVALNHLLLATMLLLARGHSFRESRLFSTESISTDLVLAVVGVAVAALSTSNAALVLAACAPLLLADRLFRLTAAANRAPARSR